MSNSQEEQLDKFIADLWVAMTRLIKKTRNPGGQFVEEYDLTPQQVFTLLQLKENEPMRMGELSGMLSVTHGVATRMADRLLKKGMVERRRDENDRRVVHISLTRLGTEVITEVIADFFTVLKDVFKEVPQHDREEYLALLGRIEKAQSGESGDASKNGGLIK